MEVLNIPNTLTLLRLIAVPIFAVLLLGGRNAEALGIFVAAGVTDALDGAIARLTNTKTTLGSYLDPTADKLLLLTAFLALGAARQVPAWLVAIVASRDVVVVLGYVLLFVMTSQAMEIRPSLFGKLATFLQLSSVTVVLFTIAEQAPVVPAVTSGLFQLTGLVTTAAGAQYVYRGLVWLQSRDTPA
jgi:cardiolipin synthase